MKQSEFTEEWQRVLVPAEVRIERDGEKICGYTLRVRGSNDSTIREGWDGEPVTGRNLAGIFECPAYRHFIPVDKWPKRKPKP